MKVKFLESQRYNGKMFKVGETHKVDEETAYALGSSIEILEGKKASNKVVKKEVKEPEENKMVENEDKAEEKVEEKNDDKKVKVITK